jgi:hypothetical protein
MKGLLIKSPWIDKILNGEKTWEIRGSNTNIRGKIALIKSGSGTILGTVEIVDSIRLPFDKYQSGEKYHCVPTCKRTHELYKNTHAWIMRNPVKFEEPIGYKHPMGAVIWVNLSDTGYE